MSHKLETQVAKGFVADAFRQYSEAIEANKSEAELLGLGEYVVRAMINLRKVMETK